MNACILLYRMNILSLMTIVYLMNILYRMNPSLNIRAHEQRSRENFRIETSWKLLDIKEKKKETEESSTWTETISHSRSYSSQYRLAFNCWSRNCFRFHDSTLFRPSVIRHLIEIVNTDCCQSGRHNYRIRLHLWLTWVGQLGGRGR